MRSLFLGLAFLAVATSRLSAQTSQPAAPTSPPLPSVALPPSLDAVLRAYEKAWRVRDAATLSTLFTEDGMVMQDGKPPVRGRAAIRQALTGNGGAPLQLRALAFDTAGTVGYILGAYGYGEARGDVGKFTLTLRKTSGRWLIVSDMDNTSVPPR